MKTILLLGWLMLCMVLVGCDTQTESEKKQEELVQNIKDEQASWEAIQDASYARVDQLKDAMSYEQVVDILGDAGDQKMDAQAGSVQRTIFEWTLDGDILVRATFDDGIMKKWESN